MSVSFLSSLLEIFCFNFSFYHIVSYFCLLPNSPRIQNNKNTQHHTTVGSHKADFSVGWDTETKTHTSAAQFEPCHGSLVIPAVYHCTCLWLKKQKVCVLQCVLFGFTAVGIHTHPHPHTSPHTPSEHHPPPLLTFAISFTAKTASLFILIDLFSLTHTYPHTLRSHHSATLHSNLTLAVLVIKFLVSKDSRCYCFPLWLLRTE